MLTPLGWGLVLVTALAGIILALVGWAELLAFLLAGLAMLVIGLVMSRGNLGCRAELDLNHTHLSVGQNSELSLTLSNPGSRTTRGGKIKIMVGDQSSYLILPALSPGQSDRLHLSIQAMHRGVIPVGPVTIEVGDPFGTIRRQGILADGGRLYIHPKTVDLMPIWAGLQRDLEGEVSSGIVDDDLEFHALRPYEPGDDVKRVHWLSTAKTGSLMVRQYEPTLRTDTALWIDTDPRSYDRSDEFELAVSIFSSLGARCLLDNRHLMAIAPSWEASQHQSSNSGSNLADENLLRTDSPRAFLDDCSGIHPDKGTRQENPTRTGRVWLDLMESHARNTSLIILVSGSTGSQETFRSMTTSLSRSIQTLTLTADLGSERSIQGQGILTHASLGTLNDLPLIMETLS